MSLKILKAGIADSIQDGGRFGFQHLAINPSGPMDLYAMQVGNALAGNPLSEATVELFFPASHFLFEKSALISISGADFGATINNTPIRPNRAVFVKPGDELSFRKNKSGSIAYLSVHGGLHLTPWLESRSTNLKANAGGWQGRSLQKGDVIPLRTEIPYHDTKILPWFVDFKNSLDGTVRCTPAREWSSMDTESRKKFFKQLFTVSTQSDRMGYRLRATALKRKTRQELLSTGVTMGTVQLLPDGQLIVLMADHQTTGGYPRIAHVITTDLGKLAQHKPGDQFKFLTCTLEEAEKLNLHTHRLLRQIQLSCELRLRDLL